MHRSTPRVLALLAAAALIAGFMMAVAPAAFAAYHVNAQASPSQSQSAAPSDTATAAPSPSSSGSTTPLPGGSSVPTSSESANPSPSDTTGASEAPSPDTSVLGEQIPKTGAGYAMPLLLGGTALAIASFVLHRRLSRSS